MKAELSSVDIHILVRELKQELTDVRLDKVYQLGRKLRIKLRQRDQELVIAPKFICLSSYARKSQLQPTSFAMQLRKHLSGGMITEVRQHNFDRIILISIGKKDRSYTLIIELFSRGNVFLCENGKILGLLEWQKWKDRVVGVGQEYNFPPEVVDPLKVKDEDFKSHLDLEKSAASALATGLNIGGLYAEEICLLADVERSRKVSELSEEEVARLYKSFSTFIETIRSEKISPMTVMKDGNEIAIIAFKLEKYKGYEMKPSDTFNHAVDEYFSKREMAEVEVIAEDKSAKRLKKLETIKKKQEETILDMKVKTEKYKKAGDLIFQKLNEIQSIVSEVKKARKEGASDSEITKRFDRVKSLDKNRLMLNFDILM